MNKKEIKRIGFFKLGKAIKFNEDAWNAIGGDCEPKQLICSIAKRNPEIEYWVLSPNDLDKYRKKSKKPKVNSLFGPPVEEGTSIPKNIKEFHSTLNVRNSVDEAVAKIKSLDLDLIFFYTGPTGTVNIENYVIKKDGSGLSKVLDSFKFYAGPIIKAMNELENEIPILGLLVDNRYILRSKDWHGRNRPSYFLAQNNFTTEDTYFSNPPTREIGTIKCTYEYSGIETVFLLDKERYNVDELFKMKTDSFLMLQNQGKGAGGLDRWPAVKEYIVDQEIETDIYGKWDEEIKNEHPKWFKGERRIETMTDELLKTKYTFCVPIKEGMVTSKYAEMLHYGIIPFLHPSYDTEFNVFPEGHFIRCKSPEDLKKKIKFLNENPEHYKTLFYNLQEKYLKDSYYTGEHVDSKIWEAFNKITNKTEANV